MDRYFMNRYFYQNMLTYAISYNDRMHCYAMLGMLSIEEYQRRVSPRYRRIRQLVS